MMNNELYFHEKGVAIDYQITFLNELLENIKLYNL